MFLSVLAFFFLLSLLTLLQFDGLEAVNKIQEGSKYDLILMDIIMPNLDGVSACHLIRQFDRTPIIAMTSNIRSDDIQLYFQHGEHLFLHCLLRHINPV
jgi:osomolarity two-component system response regulator SKN7